MSAIHLPNALVVSAGTPSAASLGKLVARTSWPLLAEATASRLCQAVDLEQYLGVWFWIERRQYCTTTASLVAWLRRRKPNIQRFALAYQQDQDVEFTLRSAGVNAYFLASGNLSAIVEEAMSPLRPRADRSHGTLTSCAVAPIACTKTSTVHLAPELARPP
jgi:hypothetical protein